MTEKLKDANMDFLFDSILKLETREECYKFFEDLCTVNDQPLPELWGRRLRHRVRTLRERRMTSFL